MRPGVKFKNISSRDLGLTMRTVNWPIIPSSTRSIVNVPNRPGSVDFGTDTYLDGDATLVFSWICKTPAEALEKGLLRAIDDGSFDEKFFNNEMVKMVLKHANLKNRRVLKLHNPTLPPLTPVNNPKLWIDISTL